MSALLELQSVETDIGGSRILRGVTLEVNSGEVVALMGRNGVGKTTTLRSITGLRPIRSGSITLAGQRIDRMPPDARGRAGIRTGVLLASQGCRASGPNGWSIS